MIRIDGSHGEGGGQVLRSALSLSAVTGIPFTIRSIRANRPKPGLRPQHMTGLNAMAEVCGAEVSGAAVGSKEVAFVPHGTKPGKYFFDVSRTSGSAGSVTLVAQTLVPALALTNGRSRIKLRGGTHVAWSPSYDFFADSFIESASRFGLNAGATISGCGYYPKGGGEIAADVGPAGKLAPVDFAGRGELLELRCVSAVSNLPMSIAQRQADAVTRYLSERNIGVGMETRESPSPGQGTYVYLSARYENITAGFSALGERGKRAEVVGEEAASALASYIESGACVEEHLSDQLVLYMALASGVSKMTVQKITGHLLTNIWVVGRFLPEVVFEVDGAEGGPGMVTVRAPGFLEKRKSRL